MGECEQGADGCGERAEAGEANEFHSFLLVSGLSARLAAPATVTASGDVRMTGLFDWGPGRSEERSGRLADHMGCVNPNLSRSAQAISSMETQELRVLQAADGRTHEKVGVTPLEAAGLLPAPTPSAPPRTLRCAYTGTCFRSYRPSTAGTVGPPKLTDWRLQLRAHLAGPQVCHDRSPADRRETMVP